MRKIIMVPLFGLALAVTACESSPVSDSPILTTVVCTENADGSATTEFLGPDGDVVVTRESPVGSTCANGADKPAVRP